MPSSLPTPAEEEEQVERAPRRGRVYSVHSGRYKAGSELNGSTYNPQSVTVKLQIRLRSASLPTVVHPDTPKQPPQSPLFSLSPPPSPSLSVLPHWCGEGGERIPEWSGLLRVHVLCSEEGHLCVGRQEVGRVSGEYCGQ